MGKNEFIQLMEDEPSPYERVFTDENGDYQLIVPPGLGVLAVSAPLMPNSAVDYHKASLEDFGLPVDERGWMATTNRGLVLAENFEAAKAVNFAAEEQPTVNLQVTRLTDLAIVRFIDPNGEPIESVRIASRLPIQDSFGPHGYGPTTVQLLEVKKEGRRPIVVVSWSKAFATALFPPDDPRTPKISDSQPDDEGVYSISLAPAASISGQFVDEDGVPMQRGKAMVLLASKPMDPTRVIEFPEVDVDENGKFEIKGLPGTGPYRLVLGTEQHGGVVRSDIELVSGQRLDLGKIDATSAVDPRKVIQKVSVNVARQDDDLCEVSGVVGSDSKPISDTQPAFVEEFEIHPLEPRDLSVQKLSGVDFVPVKKEGAANKNAAKVWPNSTIPVGLGRKTTRHVISGTATDASGKPCPHARVEVYFGVYESGFRTESGGETTTDGHGQFSLTAQQPFDASEIYVVATHSGFAPDWISKRVRDVPPNIKLRLRKPMGRIRGQLIDLEGMPLSAAEVRIEGVFEIPSNFDLGEWERDTRELLAKTTQSATLRSRPYRIKEPDITKVLRTNGREQFRSVKVGSDGRFSLPDVGENRMVEIVVSGRSIETSRVRVLPQDMKPLASHRHYYGKTFILPVKPGRILRGTAIDAETDQPLPQVEVTAARARTMTDANGVFEIRGLPRGIRVPFSTDPVAPKYFGSYGVLPADPQSIELTLPIGKGELVSGRVLDGQSGEPVGCRVRYLPAGPNQEQQKGSDGAFEGRRSTVYRSVSTRPDGTFEIATRAGKGFLDFHAKRKHWYRLGEGSEMVSEARRTIDFNKRIEIDVPKNNAPSDLTVELTRYPMHEIAVLDANGRPVADFHATGIGPLSTKGNVITVQEADDDDQRHLLLVHAEKHIGALLTYRPNDPPKSVSLQPLATLHGQLPSGFADSDVSLTKPPQQREAKFGRLPPDPPYLLSVVRANKSGEFELEVPAGVAYQLQSYDSQIERKARETTRELKPGEKYDMGQMELVPYRRQGGVL